MHLDDRTVLVMSVGSHRHAIKGQFRIQRLIGVRRQNVSDIQYVTRFGQTCFGDEVVQVTLTLFREFQFEEQRVVASQRFPSRLGQS